MQDVINEYTIHPVIPRPGDDAPKCVACGGYCGDTCNIYIAPETLPFADEVAYCVRQADYWNEEGNIKKSATWLLKGVNIYKSLWYISPICIEDRENHFKYLSEVVKNWLVQNPTISQHSLVNYDIDVVTKLVNDLNILSNM
jgi:hypothetical protein